MNPRAPSAGCCCCPCCCCCAGCWAIGCMGRTTAVSASTCASLNQRSSLLLPTCHLHSLCEDAPEEGPEGAVRGGGLFLEQHAWAPRGPLHSRAPSLCLCLCQLPELPLPLQLHMATLLSSPSAGEWGFKNRAGGFKSTHWKAIFRSALKTTKNN